MPPIDGPFRASAAGIDLGARLVASSTVVGSPAAATETIVGSVTIPGGLPTSLGIVVVGFVAYTVGASGTAVNLRIRQTDTAGTVVKTTGAMTRAAGSLQGDSVYGVDTNPGTAGQVYVVTMTVTAGAATSTVSAVQVLALAV